MKTTPRLFTKLILCLIILILTSTICSAEILFKDTFDVSDFGNIDDGITNAGRQSGSLAPLNYAGDADTLSNRTIIGDVDNPDILIVDANSSFALNYDFTDIGTNFVLELDAHIVKQGSWAGFALSFGGVDPTNDPTPSAWWIQSDGPQFLIYGNNFIYDRYPFINSTVHDLINSNMVHITCVMATDSFGGTNNFKTTLFANGEPTSGGSGHGRFGTMFTSPASLTNNYILLSFWAGLGSTEYYLDNLTIRSTKPKLIKQVWTNDASSLIDSRKVYTHTVNLGHNGDVTINSVTFKGAGAGEEQYGVNWKLLEYKNQIGSAVGTENNSSVSGASSNLVSEYSYSRVASTLIISELTPGTTNILTIYNNASNGPACETYVVPSDSEATITLVDQNQPNASIFRYSYVVPANGIFSVTFNNNVDSGNAYDNWRLYAFSNEIVSGGDEPELYVEPSIINFSIPIDETTNAQILAKNTGGGTVSGNITGISVPFSINTNWYSATSNTPYNLTVSFAPTEEGTFTNVINFTGAGGSQDVTLIGEAVPECSLIINILVFTAVFIRRIYQNK